MDIWNRTRASVLDTVKSDLNKQDLVAEIESIWADLSIENNNLHKLDATHIKDMYEEYSRPIRRKLPADLTSGYFPNNSEDAPPGLMNSDDEDQAASTIQDSDFSAPEVPSDSPPLSPLSPNKNSRAATMSPRRGCEGRVSNSEGY